MSKLQTAEPPECEAFEKFNSSLKEWLQRFHDHREFPEKDAGSGTYARFEPFFVLLAEHLEKDKSFITDLLCDKSICQSLLLEGEQDTRDRVLRLYALYERFLQELREEVNGDEKGENCGKFGTWLYSELPTHIKHPRHPSKVTGNPIEAILPGYDCDKERGKREYGIEDAISQLNELEMWFKKERFNIADYPARPDDVLVHLDWSDWHGFLYGIRNAEGHGFIVRTLKGGCLDEKRRERIRKFLELVIVKTDRELTDYKHKYQHYWALDMLRLLTDAEHRLWLAEGKKGKEITDPVHNVPWSKYKREVMCETVRYAASRTEFEMCLSYSVKLWIPRMMTVLTERLVQVLICLPLFCNPVSPMVVQSDQQPYGFARRSLVYPPRAEVASDDDGTQ